MELSRRRFLTAAAATTAIAATGSWLPATARSAPRPTRRLPDPRRSGIEHIVVLCMENRSFDHMLGWVPGADGRQDGLVYLDDAGDPHHSHHLHDWQGCAFNDPDHSYEGGRVQLGGGRCDGFRKGDNDDFALGYYLERDLVTTSALVRNFTIFDRWFCGILGPTYPNRFYTHAAATDRISNTSTTSTLPTIWDRLADADVPATYYFSDVPFLALWGTKYASISRPIGAFFADAAAGTLPAYSYLDPAFLGEGQGGSNDDHPHADVRRGQALIGSIVRALAESPAWERTVLVVTYDEWGGFFDHVAPPSLPDAFAPTATEEHNTAGFRVPTYLVSPFSPAGGVSGLQLDHSAIPAFVEWRWGLAPLTPRDAASANLARALDFRGVPNLMPPQLPIVVDPGPHVCTPGATGGMAAAAEDPMWRELAALPQVRGFG